MDSPAARQLLKVLSGPHAGGEVLLADGEYALGSDDASEIVLTDSAIAPRHAQLSVRGGRVECRALEGARILLDGTGTDGAQLAAYQCFTLGNTHLAVGPAEGRWPSIELPQSQTPEPLPPAVETDEIKAGADADEPIPRDAPAPALPQASTTVPRPVAKPAHRGMWAAAAAVLLIGVVLIFLAWRGGSDTPPGPVASREQRQATLKIAIDKLGFGDTVAVTDQHGKFIVSGHVPTPADKKAVRQAVQALDRTARMRVYDAEALISGVADALRMYKLDFTASAGAAGEVIVGGVLKDVPQWTKVRQQIVTDMPQLVALTEKFSNVAQPESAGAAPTADAADSEKTPTDAVTTAQAPAAAAAWLGPGLPPIHSISIGNYQALTLTNGEHVFRGAVLESGYTVTEIAADRVVLTRNGRQHIIKIGI